MHFLLSIWVQSDPRLTLSPGSLLATFGVPRLVNASPQSLPPPLHCSRVQARGGLQIEICNGVQNSKCPGNISKIYIECHHPPKPELVKMTHGAEPLRAVLHSNSCAANLWHGHLTYLQPLTGFTDTFNCCGHALSQGDGSDFHPRCNWEASPPGSSACVRAWRRLAPCHGATHAQT